MQHSLQKQVDDLKEETLRLSQHGNMLRAAYDKIIETDEIKTSFLHYITGQMTVHTENVDKSATKLCNGYQDLSRTEADQQVDNIQRRSHTIVELLNLVAHYTESDTGKEASHE
jgi:methyl-accepting chemotaxis protein